MQRFSVSVDDELAAWIEDKANERGVSKAKIIRDSVETARVTGLVRSDDVEPTEAKSLLDRIEMLETRVEAIESAGGQSGIDESVNDTLIAAFKRQLAGQPPTTDHGEKAVTRVFELLLQEGKLSSKELRNRLAPEFKDHFSDAESMWQSTQRHLSDLDGIIKPGEGMWEADPSAIDTETGGFDNWN